MKRFDPDIFMAGVYREAGENFANNTSFRQACTLLPMQGEEFLKEAYSAILGRAADPSGLEAYKQRSKTLPGRFLILAALYFSPERMWLPPWKRGPLKACSYALRIFRRS